MKLTAAVIGPAHGLKGEALIDVRTDAPEIFTVGAVFDVSPPRATKPKNAGVISNSPAHENDTTPAETSEAQLPESVTIASVRVHKDRVLVRFDEASSRESVEKLRGAHLLVDEHEEEDAWYVHDLKGLDVRDLDDRHRGVVAGVQSGAAQDLLLVRVDGRNVMVPFVEELVPEVNVDGGYVRVDAIPGLFDDNAVSADAQGRQ
ncbi:ribosome maturation factor RimM [Schaalia sp. ZJ1691]|uniref:ribosome maturation factor RimM n=1 Tax=Schaalia sp. ZJ1691 TaxID=2709404 RepID=UPI0013EA135C|nr:ribosome maturation factor RimM [Schaalia sp. ZJ1691]